MKRIPFTEEGLEKLKKEQEELTQKRKETVKSVSRAREMGDLSENGLYKAAKSKLYDIDRQLRRIKYFLTYATPIKKVSKNKIDLGSKILLETEGETKEFEIVGDFEANPREGKISQNSPLGKELMNKESSQSIEIVAPNNKIKIYIIKKIY